MTIIAILVAAIASFAGGAAWYMTLSKQWLEASEVPTGPDGAPLNSGPTPHVVSFVAQLLVAIMLRHILEAGDVESVFGSALSGFGVGLFFIAPWLAMNYAYSARKPKLIVLDGGYAILGPTIIGFVLGLF
ncbi:hypothetical protein OG2516_11641 [Oceanicola granulosus HTCC2516]|uniref:DUF1761 domain-containing protein n=1 Tax=Oceanicola granulosus (strain ATCC BAA-861 / DSM 15982 / KCTC 12143 / HTCC2516) TaxID=314256 RepID=Q2CJM5_OCEGH|nr:DUF1761 domain-containing protein [Oceanicola granulosus]EAR53114.1 hypothetical protein OG2516_11641 [Oceanicola granulosus HTCC2516]